MFTKCDQTVCTRARRTQRLHNFWALHHRNNLLKIQFYISLVAALTYACHFNFHLQLCSNEPSGVGFVESTYFDWNFPCKPGPNCNTACLLLEGSSTLNKVVFRNCNTTKMQLIELESLLARTLILQLLNNTATLPHRRNGN